MYIFHLWYTHLCSHTYMVNQCKMPCRALAVMKWLQSETSNKCGSSFPKYRPITLMGYHNITSPASCCNQPSEETIKCSHIPKSGAYYQGHIMSRYSQQCTHKKGKHLTLFGCYFLNNLNSTSSLPVKVTHHSQDKINYTFSCIFYQISLHNFDYIVIVCSINLIKFSDIYA